MASFFELCQRCSATVRFIRPQLPNTRVVCDACEDTLKDNEESAREAAEQARRAKVATPRRAKKGLAAKKR